MPLGLAAPAWVDDPGFDLRWHVRSTALPSPGGDEEVARLFSRVMSRRMDRGRPLWEYWFVEGLAEGRWGLLSKLHHSLADGVSGTDLYQLVLDPTPDQRPAVPDTWEPAPPSSTAAFTALTHAPYAAFSRIALDCSACSHVPSTSRTRAGCAHTSERGTPFAERPTTF